MAKFYNEHGRIKEIQENGETVFNDSKRVDRSKISKTTLEEYVNAETAQEERDALFHILTGYTKTEAENEVQG